MSLKTNRRLFTYGAKKTKVVNQTWNELLEDEEPMTTLPKARSNIWSAINTSPFKSTKSFSNPKNFRSGPFEFNESDENQSDPFSFDSFDSQGSSQSTESPVKSPNKKRSRQVKSVIQGKKYMPGKITFSADDIKVTEKKKIKIESNRTKKTSKETSSQIKNKAGQKSNKGSRRANSSSKLKSNRNESTLSNNRIDLSLNDNCCNSSIENSESSIEENKAKEDFQDEVKEKDIEKTCNVKFKTAPLFSYYNTTNDQLEKKGSIYLGSKRPNFGESDDESQTKENKSKVEDVASKGSKQDSRTDSQTSTCSQSSNSSASSSQKLRSPFKTLKPKYNLNRDVNKLRRFSGLPTSIETTTLEDDDDMLDDYDDNHHATNDDNVPAALYSTFLFPSRPNPIMVKRSEKELYKVVRNVKKASECIEYGEAQQYEDDLEYLLDGVKDNHNTSTRCLSALELAKKCLKPNFRLHVKAHGIIESVFKALQDAVNVESLAFCTCAVFFVLANDKMMIDFDDKIIEFILQLVSREPDKQKTKEYEKIHSKAKKLLQDCDNLSIDELNANNLALETLLSITSRQTGVWFKEKVRTQGGIDHIIDAVYDSTCYLQDNHNSSKTLSRMRRCIELLCDVTICNVVNQNHLLTYREDFFISTSSKLLKLTATDLNSDTEVDSNLLEERELCIVSILKLLVTLTHRNSIGIKKICKQEEALEYILFSVFLPQNVVVKRSFEIITMSLALLINIVEQNPSCIAIIMSFDATKMLKSHNPTKDILSALISLFLQKYTSGQEGNLMQELDRIEKEDVERDGQGAAHFHEDEDGFTCGDKFDDTTVADNNKESSLIEKKDDVVLNEEEKKDIKYVLSKAHDNMMDSHVAAYTAILLGLIAEYDEDKKHAIVNTLPEKSFKPLRETLEKILGFVKTAKTLDDDGCETIARVILFCKQTENNDS